MPSVKLGFLVSIADVENGLYPASIPVPEPTSLTLMLIGAISLFGYALRRRKLAAA
jgi:hypothetical protein